jgi:hypothetical protein
LPAPFAPSNPVIPEPISNDAPTSAWVDPHRLATPSARTIEVTRETIDLRVGASVARGRAA